MADPNYVIGRGKLFFDPFLTGTKTVSGMERYLGNSPELSSSQNEDKVDHYSSDFGIKVKDDSVSITNDLSLSFSLDDISSENLALWFRGEAQTNALAGATAATTTVTDLKPGTYVQLGLTAGNPIGARNVSNVSAAMAGTRATGTLTLSTAVPADGDTVTVGGVVYTFKTVPAGANHVLIGATINDCAANLEDAVNADATANPFYATSSGAVVTFHADEPGTAGNSITLAKTFATSGNGTVSGATFSGGSASGTTSVDMTGNFEVDAVTGRVFIVESPLHVAAGDDVTFTYDAAVGTEDVVIAAGTVIMGRLVFISDNAAGQNRDYIWPYAQIRPDGDFALKGDDWQKMTFSAEVLKLNDSTERQYIVKR